MKKLLTPTTKKRLLRVFNIWQTITTIVLFIIILPIFLTANNLEHFFLIVISASVIVMGIAFIIRQALKKKFQKYIDHALIFLIIATSIIIAEAFLIETLPIAVNISLLTISAFLYAYALKKIGVGYILII